jgi:hypothetical protein
MDMRLRLIILAAALLSAGSASAQDALPQTFAGWTTTAASGFRAGPLEGPVSVDEPILVEYGKVGAERRSYARGGQSLTVTLLRMRDPSAAYGAFTFLRTAEMQPSDLALHAAASGDRVLFVAGEFLADASATDIGSLAGDLKVLASLLQLRADRTPFPTLGQYLPARGMLPLSERYVLGPAALNRLLPLGRGDWLGFAYGAEAQLARYRLGSEELTLLLAVFPTPQGAARKLEELGHWFHLNPPDEKAAEATTLFARRSSTLVAIVAGTRSPAAADSLFNQIRYETQLTWNEPGFRAAEPTFPEMIVGTFVGTGILLLFAFVAGLGFGGVRLIIKLLLPGVVFDRPTSVEILQLGLTSKPINASDFYGERAASR